jgi:hypothetical protein
MSTVLEEKNNQEKSISFAHTSDDYDNNDKEEVVSHGGFVFTENSDLYVVCVDGYPSFYVKDKKIASEKMWELAHHLSSQNLDRNVNCVRINNNELHLISNFKMFIISYDNILHRVSYTKVKECIV